MKTVLVTGATGLIGSHLVQRLMADNKMRIIALSRSENKLAIIFAQYVGCNNFKIIPMDICDTLDYIFEESIDVIFHAASPISGAIIQQRPIDVIKPNLTATQNLLDEIIVQRDKTGINAKMIAFSSATVYGAAKQSDINVTELDTLNADSLDNPNAAYSESKRMAEVLARAYVRQHGLDVVIARPSWVYGEAMFPPDTAMFSFIDTATRGNDIILNKSGTAKRDNIYIDDVVDGLLTLADKGVSGEAYNISSGGEGGNFAAIDEIAEIIASVSNEEAKTNVKVHYRESQHGKRAGGIMLDNSKLRELSALNRITPLVDGIRMIIKNRLS